MHAASLKATGAAVAAPPATLTRAHQARRGLAVRARAMDGG
jgi:hypothetical protein